MRLMPLREAPLHIRGCAVDSAANMEASMPTYDYECESCGHRYERFQSMTDEPERVCPECGCAVRRLIGSGAGIIFKGAGFYATDYRKGSCPEGRGACESAKPSPDDSGHTCSGSCCCK